MASDRAQKFSHDMISSANFLLEDLLVASIDKAGDINDLTEQVLGEELKALTGRYELGEKILKELPDYAAGFFEELEQQGRYAGSESLSLFLKTFTGRLGHQTVKRPGAKIGRNDTCPCGSGKKYKKCCLK